MNAEVPNPLPPQSRVLVVLPTYNESDNVEPMIQAVQSHLPEASIWVVDDNSPDGTGEIADAVAARNAQVTVIHRPGKMGLGTAYVEAFQRAIAEEFDCVLQMDADFSHDPRYLPELLDALQDADMVIGSRYTEGGGTQNWSTLRQAISRGGNGVARVGLGVKTHDATGGYRAFRRSTLERLDFGSMQLRGYGFQIEVVFQVEHMGLRIREVPIIFVERRAGKSKMSRDIVLEAVMHIIRRRFRRVIRSDATPSAERPSPALEKGQHEVVG